MGPRDRGIDGLDDLDLILNIDERIDCALYEEFNDEFGESDWDEDWSNDI